MCAPTAVVREAVIKTLQDAMPKSGAVCASTPEDVIAWIKANQPDAWHEITELISPTSSDCDYRLVMNVRTIIEGYLSITTDPVGRVQLVAVEATPELAAA